MRKICFALVGSSVLALSMSGIAHAQDAADEGGLSEIIVTAQKREQRLQDVPVSVTAITAESLQANRIQNLLDLNAAAPNLTARASAGGSNLPTVTMRGMYASGAVPGSEKQVGFYIDGVYVAASGGSVFDLASLERIEVLRGPQGTLFGQNATAGAISIFTPDPKGELAVQQDVTIGNYSQFRSRTHVDLPAFGPFSAAFTYEHMERDGDVRNLGAGTTWDYRNTTSGLGLAKSPERLGDQNRETIQAAVKLDLGDFTATYKFFHIELDATPEAMGLIDVNPPGLGAAAGALLQGVLNAQATPLRYDLKRPDAINNAFSLPSRFKNDGHIFTMQYRASESLSFKNTFGYLKNSFSAVNQLDGLGGLVNTSAFLGPVGQPFIVYANTTAGKSRQWSDEFQANFDSDLVTITAGYLHFDARTSQGSVPGAANSYIVKTIPNFVVPAGNQLNTVHTKSDAVYAQGELHIVPGVDIVGGIRYTWDDKLATTDIPNTIPRFQFKDSRATYSAGVNYKPNPDTLVYAKYSTAYMAGGAFAGWTWQPETSGSWEAGLKADLFNRRARFNLAVFSVKYKNTQGVTSGTVLAANTGRSELTPIPATVANVGDIRARGFEIDGSAVPVDGLTLGFGLGFTDAKYTRITPLFGGTVTSLDLTYRPKWTMSGSVQYDTPPVIGEAFVRARVDVNYRSRYDAVATNYTARLRDVGFAPETAIVNGRLALTNLELGGATFELAGWVRNLTNNRALAFPIATPFVVSTTYERARTFGLDAQVKF